MAERDDVHEGALGAQQIQLIGSKLDTLAVKLEKMELQEKLNSAGDGKPTPWWTILVGVLGIPALLVTMYLQLTQATGTLADKDKSVAEISKLRTDELKTRAELQVLLDNLSKERAEGLDAYERQLRESQPLIEAAIVKLREASELRTQPDGWLLLAKYIVLWAALMAIGLFFDIFHKIWSALLNGLMGVLFFIRPRYPDDADDDLERKRVRYEQKRKRYDSFMRYVQVAYIPLVPLPGIADWAVRIFVFVAVIIPFVNQLTASFGAPMDLASAAQSVAQFNLGEAVGKLQLIIGIGQS